MPTYRNTSLVARLFDEHSTPIEPNGEATTAGYLPKIPAGFELVDDGPDVPAPWVVLAQDTPAEIGTVTGLAAYDSIHIVNESSASISVAPNGLTAHAIPILANSERFIDITRNERGHKDLNSLAITGSGTGGNVTVEGMITDHILTVAA